VYNSVFQHLALKALPRIDLNLIQPSYVKIIKYQIKVYFYEIKFDSSSLF